MRRLGHLKAVVPGGEDERFHFVEVVVVAGGLDAAAIALESGLAGAAAHHHGVQDDHLVPRHVDVQAVMTENKVLDG